MSRFKLCEKCRDDYVRFGDIRRHAQTIACGQCGPEVKLYMNAYERTSDVDIKHEEHITANSRNEKIVDGYEAIDETIGLIKQGKIVAVKDIGGYHFCFDPFCDEAGRRLRKFKKRDNKPFAVMFCDIDEIKKYAFVSEKEEEILKSDARPIVLLDTVEVSSREGDGSVALAASVCGVSDRVGAMLPCNPIQLLLLKELKALVMTSGNRGGEPIITNDSDIIDMWRDGTVDAVLTHNREILNGLDDSIFQVVKIPFLNEVSQETPEACEASCEFVQTIRRARGIVPEPVELPFSLTEDVIAAGGDLKSVFALGRKNMAYLSGHFGDLEDVASSKAYRGAIESLTDLLGIDPKIAVCDAHPGYRSAKMISDYIYNKNKSSHRLTGGADLSGAVTEKTKYINKISHHYAHVASVMAEHDLKEDVIGLAFDGTGYGDDGTVWGSEFLLCHDHGYERVGHFSSIPMIASDDAAKNAYLSLYAYLYQAEKRGLLTSGETEALFELLSGKEKLIKEYGLFCAAMDSDVNAVRSSSMGRLFDAAGAALGICHVNTYEGECAVMLEQAANHHLRSVYTIEKCTDYNMIEPSDIWVPVKMVSADDSKSVSGGCYEADSVFLMAGLVREKLYGENIDRIAFMFHQAIADASLGIMTAIRSDLRFKSGVTALSGGTMCNRVLLSLLIPAAVREGFKVYINEKVPCGDGGIALGQLYSVGNSL